MLLILKNIRYCLDYVGGSANEGFSDNFNPIEPSIPEMSVSSSSVAGTDPPSSANSVSKNPASKHSSAFDDLKGLDLSPMSSSSSKPPPSSAALNNVWNLGRPNYYVLSDARPTAEPSCPTQPWPSYTNPFAPVVPHRPNTAAPNALGNPFQTTSSASVTRSPPQPQQTASDPLADLKWTSW